MSAALVRLLTASRARDARACRRRHHLRYGLGYRPVVAIEQAEKRASMGDDRTDDRWDD